MTTSDDYLKVCTVITAIAGNDALVLPNYGSGWDGTRYVGYAAQVEANGFILISTAPTQFEAACNLLARVRKMMPERAEAVEGNAAWHEGMALYNAHVDAKTDAALSKIAAIHAETRGQSFAVAAE